MKELRSEAEGFVLGVHWAALHMLTAAIHIREQGFPQAANALTSAAEELRNQSRFRANELWPPFDPLTPGSKGLLGPG
jgi:hypothetical protein